MMDVPFESTDTPYRNTDFLCFRVGTCNGLWRATETHYEILAVINHKRGNGHFEKTMWWFEQSCKRDGKSLLLREVWNPFLYYKSIKHYGYKRYKKKWFTLEKTFNEKVHA